MHVIKVIAHLALCALKNKHRQDTVTKVRPHDDVNLGQSSNDPPPSAMHSAAADRVNNSPLSNLHALLEALAGQEDAFQNIVMLGWTHWQDATPLTLGQEFIGDQAQFALCEKSI
jgi:fumarate hydratase class II